jgi:hypothetical protein
MSKMVPASPKFVIGQYVKYHDHHNRPQTGAVMRIEASWGCSVSSAFPYISYTVYHPTYKNRRIHLNEGSLGAVK